MKQSRLLGTVLNFSERLLGRLHLLRDLTRIFFGCFLLIMAFDYRQMEFMIIISYVF